MVTQVSINCYISALTTTPRKDRQSFTANDKARLTYVLVFAAEYLLRHHHPIGVLLSRVPDPLTLEENLGKKSRPSLRDMQEAISTLGQTLANLRDVAAGLREQLADCIKGDGMQFV